MLPGQCEIDVARGGLRAGGGRHPAEHRDRPRRPQESEFPSCRELPREVVVTVWNDFVLYYAGTGRAFMRADAKKKPTGVPEKDNVCRQSRQGRGAPPTEETTNNTSGAMGGTPVMTDKDPDPAPAPARSAVIASRPESPTAAADPIVPALADSHAYDQSAAEYVAQAPSSELPPAGDADSGWNALLLKSTELRGAADDI
jgi:hypothetical protein